MNVYRFNDFVAISPPIDHDGTIYLTQMQAFEICIALLGAAEDVGRVPFTQSKCSTVEIEASGSRYQDARHVG